MPSLASFAIGWNLARSDDRAVAAPSRRVMAYGRADARRPHGNMTPGRGDRPRLDHLVYATPDLAATSAELARRTGIEPSAGGRHDGYGTHNRLASLGDRAYLEIIGPDPDQPSRARPLLYSVDALDRARLMGWAVATDDLESAVARARDAGYELGRIASMSRTRADGEALAWRLTLPLEGPDCRVVPFLIDWGGTDPQAHPAATSAPGLELLAIRAMHPEAACMQAVLDALGVQLTVESAAQPALEATLVTPHGHVVLR
jgi:hypothetical protein